MRTAIIGAVDLGGHMGLWDALASVCQAVGDAVEGGVDAVVDTGEDIVDGVIDVSTDVIDGVADTAENVLGPVLSAPITLLAGATNGLLDGVRKVGDGILAVVGDAGSLIGDLLRLDFTGVFNDIGDLFIDFVILIVVDILQVVPAIARGVADQFGRNELKRFVSDRIDENFAGDRRTTIRNRIGLDGARHFGLPLVADYRVCFLDSANTPLFLLHEAHDINLYALAGLLSGEWLNGRTFVRTVNADGDDDLIPANYSSIGNYLDSRGRNGRLRVYAMSNEAVNDYEKVAYRKCRRLGVELQWKGASRYVHWISAQRHELIVTPAEDGTFPTLHPLHFDNAQSSTFLRESGLRPGTAEDERTLLVLGTFQLDSFGVTFGRCAGPDGDGGEDVCPRPVTPDRTDHCCSIVCRDDADIIPEGSACVHRDLWPYQVFRFNLAHEIGHYLGLCHFGHGMEHLMWSAGAAKRGKVGVVGWGLAHYLWSTEPEFTFDDAKNSWRFIIQQLPEIL